MKNIKSIENMSRFIRVHGIVDERLSDQQAAQQKAAQQPTVYTRSALLCSALLPAAGCRRLALV